MTEPSKIPWPITYLGRLQAVTEVLKSAGDPISADALHERFTGVTAGEVEAIMAALVLFGRAEKKGDLYTALEEL
jgi:hypothetical protein